MYSIRVCTTDDRELPAPELGLGLNWDRLTGILRREISPDAAELLAEPIHDAARGQTHWHVSANEDPVSVSDLSEPARIALLAALAERRRDILQLADRLAGTGGDANLRMATALRTVVDVPDPGRHIWSAAGKPVLTAWGRKTGVTRERDATIMTRGPAPKPEPPPLAGVVVGTASAAEPVAAKPQEPRPVYLREPLKRRTGWWYAIPAWALLAAIVLTIFYQLLPACAIDMPLLHGLFDRCQQHAQSDFDLLRDRNQALRDAVRAAETTVATIEGDCAPPRADNQTVPERGPSAPPDAKETEERSRRAQGTEGQLDVTLAWDGREDLDLHVFCPGGELWANTPHACGGTLEIDRNSKDNAREDHPVEHATWTAAPPPGDYNVVVVLYNRFELAPRDVPFTVVVRSGDDRKVFSGICRNLKTGEPVTQFQR